MHNYQDRGRDIQINDKLHFLKISYINRMTLFDDHKLDSQESFWPWHIQSEKYAQKNLLPLPTYLTEILDDSWKETGYKGNTKGMAIIFGTWKYGG